MIFVIDNDEPFAIFDKDYILSTPISDGNTVEKLHFHRNSNLLNFLLMILQQFISKRGRFKMRRIFLFALMLSAFQGIAQEKTCFTEDKKYKIDTECDLVVYKQNNDYLFRVVKGGRPYDVAGFNNVESPDDFSPKPVKFLATQKRDLLRN